MNLPKGKMLFESTGNLREIVGKDEYITTQDTVYFIIPEGNPLIVELYSKILGAKIAEISTAKCLQIIEALLEKNEH